MDACRTASSMCSKGDDPSWHSFEWSPSQIEEATAEAIEHGHPTWSHAVAFGPCVRFSRFSPTTEIEHDFLEALFPSA